jgi:excinuclease UvrABC helicase subunit UvrB
MSNGLFKIKSKFQPAGDQPVAIKSLVDGIKKGFDKQTLLGVTGSGKTFTVANVIEQIQKPTLIIAHNKTLAAQLASEYREFFPDNAVHYFVSYYDYYQPEAYMPVSDTYIEKEAQINEEIERLRHASTQALLSRKDVIIVASVSCIYGLGSPEEYQKVNLKLFKGQKISRADLGRALVRIHFERNNTDLKPGEFRALGNSVEVMPISEKMIYKIDFDENGISNIAQVDAVSRTILKQDLENIFIFPTKHFITPEEDREKAVKTIKSELEEQLKKLIKEGKNLEAEICELLDKRGYNIDYDKVLEYAKYDERLGDSHMNVPGNDGIPGARGHCVIAGTVVKMRNDVNGKNVENLKALDEIDSCDALLTQNESKYVKSASMRKYNGMVYTFVVGDKRVTCTPEHILPVYRDGKIVLSRAEDITTSDELFVAE